MSGSCMFQVTTPFSNERAEIRTKFITKLGIIHKANIRSCGNGWSLLNLVVGYAQQRPQGSKIVSDKPLSALDFGSEMIESPSRCMRSWSVVIFSCLHERTVSNLNRRTYYESQKSIMSVAFMTPPPHPPYPPSRAIDSKHTARISRISPTAAWKLCRKWHFLLHWRTAWKDGILEGMHQQQSLYIV